MHECGWDSGAARERSSALAASVASRYALGADGVGAAGCAPGRPWQPGHSLALRARHTEGGGAARLPAAFTCASPLARRLAWVLTRGL